MGEMVDAYPELAASLDTWWTWIRAVKVSVSGLRGSGMLAPMIQALFFRSLRGLWSSGLYRPSPKELNKTDLMLGLVLGMVEVCLLAESLTGVAAQLVLDLRHQRPMTRRRLPNYISCTGPTKRRSWPRVLAGESRFCHVSRADIEKH